MSSPPPVDNAFRGKLLGGAMEATFSGALSFMRRRYSHDLDGVDVAVWGVPLDTATSNRPGARFGPQAVRRASAIFDGDPQYPSGRDPFEAMAVIDYGDCPIDHGHLETVPQVIEAEASRVVDAGVHLCTIGGDHFITLPLLRAHARRHGPMALVQFDAHQDTWPDDPGKISHGTFVCRAVAEGLIDPARSVQIGIRTTAPQDFGIAILDSYTVQGMGVGGVAAAVTERVGQGPAYLTFDIDCLDPAYAPGTGTPVSGGLSSAQALMILRELWPLDWRGMDVVEVAPAYDHADITAIAASTILQHHLQMLAGKKAAR
jgi:agmatinase